MMVGVGAWSAGVALAAAEPTTQDLRQELDSLKAKVEQLESQQQAQSQQVQTSKDDATIGSVLNPPSASERARIDARRRQRDDRRL